VMWEKINLSFNWGVHHRWCSKSKEGWDLPGHSPLSQTLHFTYFVQTRFLEHSKDKAFTNSFECVLSTTFYPKFA